MKFCTLLPINGFELLPAMPGSGGAPTINCAQCLKKRTVEQKILRNREKSCTADYENSAHLSTNAHPPTGTILVPLPVTELRFSN